MRGGEVPERGSLSQKAAASKSFWEAKTKKGQALKGNPTIQTGPGCPPEKESHDILISFFQHVIRQKKNRVGPELRVLIETI